MGLAFSTESHGKNDRIHIVNTHYDDQGKRARQESSLLIRAETRKWTDAGPDKDGGPGQQSGLILLGDLSKYNGFFDRAHDPPQVSFCADLHVTFFPDKDSPEDEKGYKELVSLDPLRYKIPFLSFQDTYLHLLARGDPSLIDGGMAPGGSLSHGTILQSAPAGPRGTFTDFASPGQEADERIDVVMIALQDSAVIDSERDNAGKRARWHCHYE
ncbi:hypothetical protein QFC19_001299 [Naganishia cerealis]|uniref:Uncharacterized protein n=1 Tax=Naganishia cerealis TaxID=610337 RepID=A0ACC2WH20_9TREE|nr:hypothetical protein QFC19_001299 [Naganishia cerealis]